MMFAPSLERDFVMDEKTLSYPETSIFLKRKNFAKALIPMPPIPIK